MSAVDELEKYRPRLFGLAYRMLGNVADAEDIVQDAFLRYASASRDYVQSPPAFLSTAVTRLCLNHLRRARVRREVHVGPWLPEPIRTPETAEAIGEADPAEKDYDSISYAFLVLLERLSPPERAVFILREVFGYDYDGIAQILRKSETTCRQLFSRARRHVTESRARFHATISEQRRLIESFMAAVQTGDLNELTALLSERVVFTADGAGKVQGAALKPIVGVDAVARFLLNIRHRAPSGPRVNIVALNGRPGVILSDDQDRPFTVLLMEMADGKISDLWGIADPDKLKGVLEIRQAE